VLLRIDHTSAPVGDAYGCLIGTFGLAHRRTRLLQAPHSGRDVQRTRLPRRVGHGGVDDAVTEEIRLLRTQTKILAEEMRLLRQALRGEASLTDDESQSAAAPAPAAAAATAAVSPSMEPPRQEHRVPAYSQPPMPETAAAAPAAATPAAASPATAEKTRVKIVSAGHDVGNEAEFYLDDAKIPIHGQADRRGLNVVVIDPRAKRIVTARTYDIWGNPQVENMRLAGDLGAVPQGHLGLIALKDSGLENLDNMGLSALRLFGSTLGGPLNEREGYLLVGTKGSDDEPLVEKSGTRMLMSELDLPFKVSAPTPSRPLSSSPSVGTGSTAPAASFAGATSSGTQPPWEQRQQQQQHQQQPRRPRIDVDPQGNVIGPENDESWHEVAQMIGDLEAKIRSRRLQGF